MSEMERFFVELGELKKQLAGLVEFVRVKPTTDPLEEVLRILEQRQARPVVLSMAAAALAVSLGETKFRELVKRKEIATFMVDRRRLVRVQELEDWAMRQSTPVPVRFPKTKGKTEEQKILAKMRR